MAKAKDLITFAPLIGVIYGYFAFRGIKKVTTNDDEQIDIMSRTMWGEARSEGREGLQAVANVIMNRVKKGGWYGATPKEVCLKKYQFSCWLPNDPNYPLLTRVTDSDSRFALAKTLAALAIGGQLPDITNGATNYLALGSLSSAPSWSKNMKQVASIGAHTFYA